MDSRLGQGTNLVDNQKIGNNTAVNISGRNNQQEGFTQFNLPDFQLQS
jgi:hypothetical protein